MRKVTAALHGTAKLLHRGAAAALPHARRRALPARLLGLWPGAATREYRVPRLSSTPMSVIGALQQQ